MYCYVDTSPTFVILYFNKCVLLHINKCYLTLMLFSSKIENLITNKINLICDKTHNSDNSVASIYKLLNNTIIIMYRQY